MHWVDTWTGLWGASIPGMGAFGLFYVDSIVPNCPCPTIPPIWQIFQILLVYFDHTYIWKVSGCSNHGPILFLMLWQHVLNLNDTLLLGMEYMTCWPKCNISVLEARIRNRRVIGGKHNVLIHYVDASAPNPFGAVSATLSNEIFCGSSLIQNLVIFVRASTAK
ncbi:hypothetical protein FRACYDRAFT_255481 [Fragilariopsis cylindrus CCMP1102]|uniref:Uncharacterized protein n=1 Tax=Fragilariopsis cylindrus CCMP1102 TaxID=635003 RepID=A0A1E7EK13_9STRA|nr:hypothetical protein FRACYDRAFT_255481 [Fragilariopsis cylindrus CCMP1102]|eukprot:OEU06255.1 hypothetical protein FRACYDRAFT_255481 [Fragilariopsis cylindrus CCMP1102]